MPIDPAVLAAALKLPTTPFSGEIWNQSDPRRGPFALRRHAPYAARAHRRGDPEPLYATPTSRVVAVFEHSRYVPPDAEVHPTRLLSKLAATALPIIDFSNALALHAIGVELDDLTRTHDYELPWALTDIARDANHPALGVMLPSAAHPAAQTLVILADGVSRHIEVIEQQTVRVVIQIQTV